MTWWLNICTCCILQGLCRGNTEWDSGALLTLQLTRPKLHLEVLWTKFGHVKDPEWEWCGGRGRGILHTADGRGWVSTSTKPLFQWWPHWGIEWLLFDNNNNNRCNTQNWGNTGGFQGNCDLTTVQALFYRKAYWLLNSLTKICCLWSITISAFKPVEHWGYFMIDNINQCVRYCTEYSDGREWGEGRGGGGGGGIMHRFYLDLNMFCTVLVSLLHQTTCSLPSHTPRPLLCASLSLFISILWNLSWAFGSLNPLHSATIPNPADNSALFTLYLRWNIPWIRSKSLNYDQFLQASVL